MSNNLPDKKKLLRNFYCCRNWEEKYIYIIEIGKSLSPFPLEVNKDKYLISGCQSKVWIFIKTNSKNKNNLEFYGDSDSLIVKGLIAVTFVFYKNLKIDIIVKKNINPFIEKLSLNQYLTPSRFHGLGSIVRAIQKQIHSLYKNTV